MSLRLPSDEYHALCAVVLRRDGYKCKSCGLRSGLSCHHVIYRSHQGEDEAYNLVVLCECCHKAVHSKKLFIEFDKVPEVFHFIRKGNWRPK